MTITTAKLPLRVLPALLAVLLAPPSHAAAWKLTPTVGVTETYTDNVNLRPSDQAKSSFVSEATAGFSLVNDGPRLQLAAAWRLHAFAYSGDKVAGTRDSQSEYQAAAKGKLVDELLYFDASASRAAQSSSAFGPQVNNNLYSLGNRENVSTWRISPYLRHRFGTTADVSLRYTRDAVDAGPRNAFGSSSGNSVALDLASGPRFQNLGWTLNYNRQDLDSRVGGESSSEAATAGLRYRLSRTLAATATAGYDRYDYKQLGGRTQGRNWSGGFIWTPSTRTNVQASLGRHYYGQTGSLAASHRSRHSVWSVNYSDGVTTSRSQFLLPAAIDTASMLDRLLAASIPDPVARQLAVAAYIQSAGLPASLANSVNYLSNRYLRQKQLQAAAAFTFAHSNLVFSAFDTARTALSSQQSDSELLGSQLLALNDDTRQRGASAIYSYALNGRTSALLAATATRSRSISTGIETDNRMLRLGMTRKFASKLSGIVELRHVTGGTGALDGSTYRENAVSATLSIQL
jgi:uncharacterized protein (PEP-CTERM system associated)